MNKIGKKIISTSLIAIIVASQFAFVYPKKAEAGFVDDAANFLTSLNTLKSSLLDTVSDIREGDEVIKKILLEISKSVAQKALTKVTESTVDWINTGYSQGGVSGEPLYLKDPEGFFKNLANTEVDKLVSEIGYDPEKYPFGADVAISLIESEKATFEEKNKFTLEEKYGPDWEAMEDDFTIGGWDAYIDMISNPANTPIGSLLAVSEEVEEKKSAAKETVERELSTSDGGGILSIKECVEYKEGYEPEGLEGYTFESLSEFGTSDNCLKYETTTPGSVISSQLTKAATSGIDNAQLKSALGGSLSQILDALLNKIFTEGFNKLSTDTSPIPTDATYQGQTVASVDSSNAGNSGADIEVNLAEVFITGPFNPATGIKDINNSPKNLTASEVAAMSDIIELSQQMYPKLMALDSCLPGPDYGYEERLDREFGRESAKLQKKSSKDDAADGDIQKFANAQSHLNSAKKLIYLRKISPDTNIPSASEIDAAIYTSIRNQQANQTYLERIGKSSVALARLKSLENEYLAAGTQEEMNNIAADYLNIRQNVSTKETLDGTLAAKDLTVESMNYIDDLYVKCMNERLTPVMVDGDGDVDVGYNGTIDGLWDRYHDFSTDDDGNGILDTWDPDWVRMGSVDFPVNVMSPSILPVSSAPEKCGVGGDNCLYPLIAEWWFFCDEIVDKTINTVDSTLIMGCENVYKSNVSDYMTRL